MLSHLALKLHYVKQETDQLALEETALASRLLSLRYNLIDHTHNGLYSTKRSQWENLDGGVTWV
jgi:hypothetical protein